MSKDIHNLNQEREKLKSELRQSMNYNGPLFINPRYLSPEYKYYLELYDTKQPFKFQEVLDKGYTFTSLEDMPGFEDTIKAKDAKFPLVDDENRIAIKINPSQTHYLMKIPKDRWELLQEIKNEDYNASIAKVVHKARKTMADGIEFSNNITSSKGY